MDDCLVEENAKTVKTKKNIPKQEGLVAIELRVGLSRFEGLHNYLFELKIKILMYVFSENASRREWLWFLCLPK